MNVTSETSPSENDSFFEFERKVHHILYIESNNEITVRNTAIPRKVFTSTPQKKSVPATQVYGSTNMFSSISNIEAAEESILISPNKSFEFPLTDSDSIQGAMYDSVFSFNENSSTSANNVSASTLGTDFLNNRKRSNIYDFSASDMDNQGTMIPNNNSLATNISNLNSTINIAEGGNDTVVNMSHLSADSSEMDTSDESLQLLHPENLQHVTRINKRKTTKTNQTEESCRKMFTKSMTRTSIEKALKTSKCCKSKCYKDVEYVDIVKCRYKHWNMKYNNRLAWLYDQFEVATTEKGHYVFSVPGKKHAVKVCQNLFMKIYNINKNTYYAALKRHKDGCIAAGFGHHRRPTEEHDKAVEWLEDFATYHGDRMPHNPDVLLPYKTRKKLVYIRYKTESENSDRKPLSRSSFSNIWKHSFPHLKIKKTNSFSKCTKCCSLERQLERTRNLKSRRLIQEKREEHNERQMNERRYYYQKRTSSTELPDRIISIIIDGMDQSKTNMPHFTGRKAKNINPTDMIVTHITGVIAHAQNELHTFLDLNQFKHDSNLTINVILRVLKAIATRKENKLPGTLYIQADNCWRENKNKFVLSFCELMVQKKIFNQVHLSFLFVGHTHEDIDAAFSRISDWLRINEAETMPDLLRMLPNVTEIKGVFDVSGWLAPYIRDMRKHTKPLHYKFVRDGENVEGFYKGLYNSPWKKLPCSLFLNGEGNIVLPRGTPQFIYPTFDASKIEKLLSASRSWMSMFSDQVHNAEYRYWTDYLNNLKAVTSNLQRKKQYSSSDSHWILPTLPQQPQPSTNETVNDAVLCIPEQIQRMLDEETEEPEVDMRLQPSQKHQNKSRQTNNSRTNTKGKGKQSGAKKQSTATRKTKTSGSRK